MKKLRDQKSQESQASSKTLWIRVSIIVYLLAFIVYVIVWAKLRSNYQIRQIRRIFRSLFIVMLAEVRKQKKKMISTHLRNGHPENVQHLQLCASVLS